MTTTMTTGFSIPILPARDLHATRTFYERLGFETGYWSPGPEEGYAILGRGDLRLHFFLDPDLDPLANYAGCYWKVPDADALAAEFEVLDLPRLGALRWLPIEDKPWGMREFAFVDMSGNLVRVGHEIRER